MSHLEDQIAEAMTHGPDMATGYRIDPGPGWRLLEVGEQKQNAHGVAVLVFLAGLAVIGASYLAGMGHLVAAALRINARRKASKAKRRDNEK